MSHELTEAEVLHVAKLSRLRLTPDEVKQYARQLSGVLDYISKLNELNLEGVEPMAHALDLSNVFRADEPQPGLPVDTVLANAPEKDPPFFKVPKVLDDGSGGA